MKRKILLGTRGSALALWQTNWVKNRLGEKFSDLELETVVVKTTGDKILDSPLSKIGDKGLFTKELDLSLLSGKTDIAVHSMKDVPTEFDEKLVIGAITERWDVQDVLISREGLHLSELTEGARIATGSLRRRAQLLHFRPDFRIIDIRGNLNTRFKKFDEADWDGMILAMAGVVRLNLHQRITQNIPLEVMLPAVGQGCFAVMCRRDNRHVLDLLKEIHRPQVATAVLAERALLRAVEGGCQVPLGAFGQIEDETLRLEGCIASLDGKQYFRDEVTFPANQPEEAGKALADKLLGAGADKVLGEIRNA
jgi:hydroxymethylbilane synthase